MRADGAESDSSSLVQALAAGDRDAWGLLAERHLETIRRVTGAVCGDVDLAEDATQECLLKLRASAGHFRPRGGDGETEARRWIQRMAANCAIDRLRRARLERSVALGGMTPQPQPEERSDLVDRLVAALQELPAISRTVIELRFHEGLSGTALASALGIGRVAARMRLHRALGDLRRRLGPQGASLSMAALPMLLQRLPVPDEAVPEAAYGLPSASMHVAAAMAIVSLALATAVAATAFRPPAPPDPPSMPIAVRAVPEQEQSPSPPPQAVRPLPAVPLRIGPDRVGFLLTSDGSALIYARPPTPDALILDYYRLDLASGTAAVLGRLPITGAVPAYRPVVSAPEPAWDDVEWNGPAWTSYQACTAAANSNANRLQWALEPVAANADATVIILRSPLQRAIWRWEPASGQAPEALLPAPPPGGFRRFTVAPNLGAAGQIAFIDGPVAHLLSSDGRPMAHIDLKLDTRHPSADAALLWHGERLLLFREEAFGQTTREVIHPIRQMLMESPSTYEMPHASRSSSCYDAERDTSLAIERDPRERTLSTVDLVVSGRESRRITVDLQGVVAELRRNIPTREQVPAGCLSDLGDQVMAVAWSRGHALIWVSSQLTVQARPGPADRYRLAGRALLVDAGHEPARVSPIPGTFVTNNGPDYVDMPWQHPQVLWDWRRTILQVGRDPESWAGRETEAVSLIPVMSLTGEY